MCFLESRQYSPSFRLMRTSQVILARICLGQYIKLGDIAYLVIPQLVKKRLESCPPNVWFGYTRRSTSFSLVKFILCQILARAQSILNVLPV